MTLRKRQQSLCPYDTLRRTTCLNCPAGCGLKVFIHQGRVVDIFGDEDHPVNKGSVCPKGLLSLFHLSNPLRLTAARIRHDLGSPFKEVTWEEALDFIGTRLERVVERHGRQSVFIAGRETDPFGYLAGGSWFAGQYGAGGGPGQFFNPGLASGGVLEQMFGVAGQRLQMNPPRDWCASRCILLFRTDPAATDPMTIGPLLDARDRGAALIAVDSTRTVTLSNATVALQVRPGTEAVLLKGLIHLLFDRHGLDRQFIDSWCRGAQDLEGCVRPFTPQRVCRECAIDEALLGRAAELIANRPPLQIIAADWYSRRFLSQEELGLCGALEAMGGTIGKAGGGLNLLCVSPFSWPAPTASGDEADPGPPLHLSRLLAGTEATVGALFCYGNAGAGLPEEAKPVADGSCPELVVHLGAYSDQTDRQAHVSLPMSYWLEHEGLVAASNSRVVQWHHKVVAAPGDCHSPLWFWTALAERCGMGDCLPWPNSEQGPDERAAADHFLARCPLTRAIRVDLLDPETQPPGGILWPCPEAENIVFEDTRLIKGNVRGINILFQHNREYPLSDRRFPTVDGLIDLAAPIRAAAQPSFSGDAARFPLWLTTGVLVDYIRDLGFFPRDGAGTAAPLVKIHPRLARILAIAPGDRVTVENSRGTVSGPAWLSDNVAPDTVWCPAGVDPSQPGFAARSPRRLFQAPQSGCAEPACTRVQLRKHGADPEESRQRVLAFLEGLQCLETDANRGKTPERATAAVPEMNAK